jgi:hypothetical protein
MGILIQGVKLHIMEVKREISVYVYNLCKTEFSLFHYCADKLVGKLSRHVWKSL